MGILNKFKQGYQDSNKTALAGSALVAGGLGTFFTFKTMAATSVVLSKVAIPGAIKTTTVVINGVPMVYNVVAASLASKILMGAIFTIATIVIAGVTYNYIKEL